jgi:enoyl-CoA hydratase/carnithine racemase
MNFSTISIALQDSVMRVTIKNEPINLMNPLMVQELFQLGGFLVSNQDIKVVVFDSADPDFFIAHFDVEAVAKAASDEQQLSKYPDINVLQSLSLSWQALPQVKIAKINGRCRGGGLEFVLGLDMIFASEESLFCFPEASGSFLACGGGTTRLTLAVGPGRALEILLSSRDFTSLEGERYGFITRAMPANELDEYVETLVTQITRRSRLVIDFHRQVMSQALSGFVQPVFDGFAAENIAFNKALETSEMKEGFAAMLAMGQTREHELNLPESIQKHSQFIQTGK